MYNHHLSLNHQGNQFLKTKAKNHQFPHPNLQLENLPQKENKVILQKELPLLNQLPHLKEEKKKLASLAKSLLKLIQIASVDNSKMEDVYVEKMGEVCTI